MQKQAYCNNYNVVFESMEPTGTKPLRFDDHPVPLPKDNEPFLHYHDRIEIGICTSGLGIFYGSNFAESVKPGDLILFFPGCAHYSRSVDDPPCMCRFAYLEPRTLLKKLFGKHERISEILRDAFSYELPAVIRKNEHPDTYDAIRILLDDLFLRESQNAELLCTLQLCEFLVKIPHRFKKSTQTRDFFPSDRDKAMAQVESYISSRYYENISAQTLCGICFLSESQLRRRFKASYGTSPMQYLKDLRCTIGAKLLLQTDFSVSDISAKVGYADMSVFYRHFVKKFGISPTEYKKSGL